MKSEYNETDWKRFRKIVPELRERMIKEKDLDGFSDDLRATLREYLKE